MMNLICFLSRFGRNYRPMNGEQDELKHIMFHVIWVVNWTIRDGISSPGVQHVGPGGSYGGPILNFRSKSDKVCPQ